MDFAKTAIGLLRNVLISAVGSAIVTVVGTLSLRLLKGKEVFSYKISVWYFVLIIFICALICFFVYFYTRAKIKSQQRVFVISCSFTTNPFFAGLLKSLLKKIERQGFVPELMCSLDSFKISEIDKHIRSVGNNKDLYIGGFIIHAVSDEHTDVCKRLARDIKKPIVFLDSSKNEESMGFPQNASFVGYDGEKIGRVAAEYVINMLRKKEIVAPKIQIIAGYLQTQRQQYFERTIRASYRDAYICIDESSDFNRKQVEKMVFDTLKSKLENNGPIWDVIFCTNDEMALGALDAIDRLDDERLKDIIIVGVDATAEAKQRIDGGDNNFVNTVVQSPEKLAEEGIIEFMRRIKNEKPKTYIFLSPNLYKNIIS